MLKNILLVTFISLTSFINASGLYSKAFGNQKDPALFFLHGGPGYNSFSFEESIASLLADMGFYVIVYDQRGCGRSKDIPDTEYTFEEAFEDLNKIYKEYKVKRATLIGHSWGGTLGTKFALSYPEKVRNLILTGSPLAYQRTFNHIIEECKELYQEQNSPQLQYIQILEKMDTTSLDYSGYCFAHAMSNGFYTAENPSDQSTELYRNLAQDSLAYLLTDMTKDPVTGFHSNEMYTLIDISEDLKKLRKKIGIYGIYGAEDGLFSGEILEDLELLLGSENMVIVDNASHNVFLDQQEIFVEKVKKFESQ